MLSGPKALDVLVCLRTARSSGKVNSDVEISSSSETRSLGRDMSSGSLGSFPRRFLKCLVQLASRLDCEPPFKRTVVLERFPEISEIVFQAA